MNSITNFFSKLNYKKVLLLIASPILAMWHNYKIMALGLLGVMLIDLITGIKVYCKENNLRLRLLKPDTWGVIQSAGLRKTMSKLKDYFLVIVATNFFTHYVMKSPVEIFGHNLTELVMVVLGVIEMWSIGENFRKTRGYNIFEHIKNLIVNRDIGEVLEDVAGKES